MNPLRRTPRTDDITMPIPLPGGKRWVIVQSPRLLSETEWAYLLAVLDVLKPGLVPADQPATDSDTTKENP